MKLHIITSLGLANALEDNDVGVCGSIMYWQYQMIEQIISDHDINELVFYCIKTPPCKMPGYLSLLFKVDQKLSGCQPSSIEQRSVNELKASHKMIATDLEGLSEKMVDIDSEDDLVINLSETTLPDKVLNKTRLGTWSIFFGDKHPVHSLLVGVREFLEKQKVVVSGIQKEMPAGEENIVLYQATTSLEPASLCRTREICLNKVVFFMSRLISQVRQQQLKSPKKWGGVLFNTANTSKICPNEANFRFSEAILLLLRFKIRILQRIYYKLAVKEQWIVLLAKNKKPNEVQTDFRHFKEITPPENEFWADPFLFEKDGKDYLFIEVFPYDRELGHLSVMEIDSRGQLGQPQKILERPYHFSYPNIFDYQGNTYMVPETGDNQQVELYQCNSFPDSWTFKHHLISGIRAYDATFVEHNGLWWLFAAVAENAQCPTTEELHIFYADSPVSQDWTAHPENPVNTDAASARPAGNFFHQDNKLYRPSQDCAGSYGAGINICEIITLDKNHYEERIDKTFRPDWSKSIIGLHTLNFNERYTVSDVIKQKGLFH